MALGNEIMTESGPRAIRSNIKMVTFDPGIRETDDLQQKFLMSE